MIRYLTKLFLCLLFILTSNAGPVFSQTPAPALQTAFTLPLTDSTTATAIILPMQDGQAYLVYATNAGKLGVYYLTPSSPNPPPPPPPPPPPIVQKLTIAIVEDPLTTTLEQRTLFSDPAWRKLATDSNNFKGIIPNDIKEIKTGLPPADLAPFLDRAKLHNLPWIMFTSAKGVILWEGNPPSTKEEMILLIHKFGG
jgi:hypothetical protein